MSRFVDNTTVEIKLSDAESVLVRKKITYLKMQEILMQLDETKTIENLKLNMPILKAAIVSWNLKDDAGAPVPCTPENIENLDSETISLLIPQVLDIYAISKKKEPLL